MQKALKAIEAGNVDNLKAAIANIENINEVPFDYFLFHVLIYFSKPIFLTQFHFFIFYQFNLFPFF